MALKILSAKLAEEAQQAVDQARNVERKQQVGVGARGDKVRTLRTQDDRVTDHRTGRTWSLKKWLKGDW